MKKSEIVSLIEKAKHNAQEFISMTASDTNPQVMEMVAKANGKISAYIDILEALRGNAVYLRIEAGI